MPLRLRQEIQALPRPSGLILDDLPISLALEGASNVRDLGGWPAPGGTVRRGRVFRAAALNRLTEADCLALRDLGIKVVCDFRGTTERTSAPCALSSVEVRSLPIEPSVGASLHDILATREATGEDTDTLMRAAYVAYAVESSHCYRALFDAVLDGAGPVLFHCSAGKDRTGFGAALILTALGVEWDVILRDYLSSNTLWRGDPVMAAGIPPHVARGLLTVRAELLEAAFAAIAEDHGSFARYAETQLGLTEARLTRLRGMLIA